MLGQHTETVTAPEHPAQVDGATDTLRVLFRASHLRDALHTLDGDTVRLQLATATYPVVFTSPEEPGYRHLVMPIRARRS